jgi:hypothetical protein
METNFCAKITSKTELTEFVDKVNFPSHAILRKNDTDFIEIEKEFQTGEN